MHTVGSNHQVPRQRGRILNSAIEALHRSRLGPAEYSQQVRTLNQPGVRRSGASSEATPRGRGHTHPGGWSSTLSNRVSKAEVMQRPERVGPEPVHGSEVMTFGGTLVDAHLETMRVEARGQCEPGYSASDDVDGDHHQILHL
ncbi:hypothetical protein [Kocuria soli]|uniref:hypothetical protein n=1 Tax=Kocuria soli TaxID=2485125 RepID=UPI001F213E4C|nr:hypothetical protein [Kocuria soli]